MWCSGETLNSAIGSRTERNFKKSNEEEERQTKNRLKFSIKSANFRYSSTTIAMDSS